MKEGKFSQRPKEESPGRWPGAFSLPVIPPRG
jgi:hypothetical protein